MIFLKTLSIRHENEKNAFLKNVVGKRYIYTYTYIYSSEESFSIFVFSSGKPLCGSGSRRTHESKIIIENQETCSTQWVFGEGGGEELCLPNQEDQE